MAIMEERFDLMLEPNDTLAEALAQEKDTLLELELTQDEEPPEPETAPRKKKLKRVLAGKH